MKAKMKLVILTSAIVATSIGHAATWFHGGFDNSASYGQTPDSSSAITWQDTFFNGGSAGTNYTVAPNNVTLQVNRPTEFVDEVGLVAFNFSGLGLTAAQVGSAQLWVTPTTSFANTTWSIRGLALANSGFDQAGSSFNFYNDPTTWVGGGGILGALTGTYGSFSTSSGNLDRFAIDVTSALMAIINNEIGGFAFVNTDPVPGSFDPSSTAFQFASNENVTTANRPGLLVSVIPEPSTALLAVFGMLALLRRRR